MTKTAKPTARPLSADAKRLRGELLDGAECDPGQLAILDTALAAWDRWQQCRAILDRDGLTTVDRWGQKKAHPLCSVERDSRAAYLSGLKLLGVDIVQEAE